MKKAIVLKWTLRAAVLAAGGIAAYAIKARNAEIEALKDDLQEATAALEKQNRIMKSIQEKLGIEVDGGSD